MGQHPLRTGMLTIGMPGSDHGIPDWAPTIADLLKEQGYANGEDDIVGKLKKGYRGQRELPDEHLAMLPVLVMARALSYVGWAHTLGAIARELEPIAVAVACELAQELTSAA
jgi:arylsulfatase A-like enzyme